MTALNSPGDRERTLDHMQALYVDALTLVERLHHRLLDATKDEFDRMCRADINPMQALLLYNIGDGELSASELRTGGYYFGSNVSRNLKKLAKMGFLEHERSCADRRAVCFRLTNKGREVRGLITALYTVKHVGGITTAELFTLNKSLHRLERFWLIKTSELDGAARLTGSQAG